MLLNINRCIDYTKATNGLKLVPHMETADITETIALPLHVMNAMQGEKTRIELQPVPKEICSHIITDKQWLEENILCLLSNAVKYSHKGVVTVSVSLVDHDVESAMKRMLSRISPKWTAKAGAKKSSKQSAKQSVSAKVTLFEKMTSSYSGKPFSELQSLKNNAQEQETTSTVCPSTAVQ